VLKRTDVVDGALALLDAEGLDGLTTRKLGSALNVQGTALYRHFPTKEALLDAVADRVLAGVGDALPAGSLVEQLAHVAQRMRMALLAHRDGARVVAGTYVSGPNTRLVEGVILEALHQGGVPADRAGWIAFALGHYVLGHTIEEQAQAALTASGGWDERSEVLAEQTTEGFQRDAMMSALAADPADRFSFGLKLFLDGVEGQTRA
jgi:TetR/AcrR family tetracycline transcriptional repressor